MREAMLADYSFTAGVFIGGMGGIIQEFDMFRRLQPTAAALPIVSTGGATLQIAEGLSKLESDLLDDLDYMGVFHRLLNVPTRERRFRRPEEQPRPVKLFEWATLKE